MRLSAFNSWICFQNSYEYYWNLIFFRGNKVKKEIIKCYEDQRHSAVQCFKSLFCLSFNAREMQFQFKLCHEHFKSFLFHESKVQIKILWNVSSFDWLCFSCFFSLNFSSFPLLFLCFCFSVSSWKRWIHTFIWFWFKILRNYNSQSKGQLCCVFDLCTVWPWL